MGKGRLFTLGDGRCDSSLENHLWDSDMVVLDEEHVLAPGQGTAAGRGDDCRAPDYGPDITIFNSCCTLDSIRTHRNTTP